MQLKKGQINTIWPKKESATFTERSPAQLAARPHQRNTYKRWVKQLAQVSDGNDKIKV